MDLSLSKKQEMIRAHVRSFANEHLTRAAVVMDRDSSPLPSDITDQMGGLNLWGIQAPEKYGGAALDSVSYALVIEEISRVSAAVGLAVTVHNSVCLAPLLAFGTDEQKERFAPLLSSGEKIGGFTVTEPTAGSDAGAIETRAVREGGSYILNGRKAFVTNGGTGEIFLTAAKITSDKTQEKTGIFIVEKEMSGFTVGKVEEMMGMRGNMVSELVLDNVPVPAGNILGTEDTGFKIAMKALDMGRIGIAAQALGIGMAAYESAARYAGERKQFKRPIGSFQGISFKLAEMKTELEAARLLIFRAANLKDKGQPYSVESAMCKLHASRTAMRVCTDALQIYGGYGYVKDLPVERFFRDAKITEIYEGTSEVMKIIIGNTIMKEFSRF